MERFIHTDVYLDLGLPDTDPVHQQVVTSAQSNIVNINNVKDFAATIRTYADELLGDLSSRFKYTISTYSLPKLNLHVSRAPSLTSSFSGQLNLYANKSSFRQLPSIQISHYTPSYFTAPAIGSFSVSSYDFSIPNYSAPTPLSVQDIQLPTMPTISASTISLPEPAQVVLATLSIPTMPDFALEPFPVQQIQIPQIQDLLSSVTQNTFKRKPYTLQQIRDALDTINAVLTGTFVVAVDDGFFKNVATAVDRHGVRVSELWSRLGFDYEETYAAEYMGRYRSRKMQQAQTDYDALVWRVRMRVHPAFLTLCAETYETLATIEGELYDADFEFVLMEALSQVERVQQLVQKANLEYAQAQAKVVQYMAQAAEIKAQARLFAQQVRNEMLIADINRAQAENYAAQQDVKTAQVQVFAAKIDQMRALASAYAAQMRAMRAKAQTLAVRVAQFEATSAQWAADLAAKRAQYHADRLRNEAVIAQNRAEVEKVSAQSASAEAISYQAIQSAATVAAQAAQTRATILSRLGDTLNIDMANEAAAINADVANDNQRAGLLGSMLRNQTASANNSIISSTNSAIARLTSRYADAIISIYRDSQQQQIRLADAYVDFYKTLADAETARVSGRLSGMRASVSQMTSAGLRFGTSIDFSASMADSFTRSDSNTAQTIFRTAKT